MAGRESELCVVLVTAPDLEQASKLARAVVEERLAACANQLAGVRSLFHWNERVEEAGEVLLVLKTARARLEQLCRRVVELHPYEVPEFLALPVIGAHPEYSDWVLQETRS